MNETKPRRRLSTWIRRREREKLGLTIPKEYSDYYVRKARIAARKAEKAGRASAGPSVISGDESDEAMRKRQPSAGPSKPRSRPKKDAHTRQPDGQGMDGDSDGEVEASLTTILESDDDDVQILESVTGKGKGKASSKEKATATSARQTDSTAPRKRQRESAAPGGVSVAHLFADDPPAGSTSISAASANDAPTAKKAKVDFASRVGPTANGESGLAPPQPPPPRTSRVQGLSIKKREETPPELKRLDMSSVPAYDPSQPLFLASPSSSGGATPPSYHAPLPDIDRTGTPSFGEPVAGIFDNAPAIDPSAQRQQIEELASWLTTPGASDESANQPAEVAAKETSPAPRQPEPAPAPARPAEAPRISASPSTIQGRAAPLPDGPPPSSPPSSQPKPSQQGASAITELPSAADMSEVEEEVEQTENDSLFGTQSRGLSPVPSGLPKEPADKDVDICVETSKTPPADVANTQAAASIESATRPTAVSSWRPDGEGPSTASTSTSTPAPPRDPIKIDIPVRKGLPPPPALAGLPKYQPPKGIQKMQDHTHVDPEIAKALARKGMPLSAATAKDKAGLPTRPKTNAVSPIASASGNKSPYNPRGGKSPASSAGGTTPLHPSMQSFSALGSGSAIPAPTPAVPSGPALQRATGSYVPRAAGTRITGSNNVPLGPARPVPTAAAATASGRTPLGTSGAYLGRGPSAAAQPPRGPAAMVNAGHLSPVHASAEPALPIRRSFGTYNPALDPRRRHMFGSGEPAGGSSTEGMADPAPPSFPGPAPPPPDNRRSALSPPPTVSIPAAPMSTVAAKPPVSSSGQMPGAIAHFAIRADLPDSVLEIKLLRGADPMSIGRNKAAKDQAAPADKPSVVHEDIASLLKRDGAKLRDLHTEMLNAYCLEGQVRCGAKVVEWLKASPKEVNRPEWDTVCGKMREGKVGPCSSEIGCTVRYADREQIFAAYLEPPGPTVECHYAIVFVAVSRVEALDIQLPAWSSAEVGIIALLVALPLDSDPLPLMPNPVRPILTLSSPIKRAEPLEGPLSLLDAYGISTDFLSSLRSKIAIFRYSHPVGPLDRLYSAVIDGFKVTGVKGLAPTNTVPPHFLILSNARLGGAIRSGTLREAVQRRTSVMVLGPSLSLLPCQWRLRPVWKSGGLVTFSPTFILRSPDRFVEIMKTIRVSPNWAAYIIPGIVEWAEASWKEPQ